MNDITKDKTNRFVKEFNPEPTDIALCGSMVHMPLWLSVISRLRDMGFSVSTPELSEPIDWSSMDDEETIRQKGRLVRRHFANIAEAKVVLVCNYEKNGIENYIGSNSFLEMSAGFIYGKPIYLLNDVPRQNNREEILALEPIILNGDLSKIEVEK